MVLGAHSRAQKVVLDLLVNQYRVWGDQVWPKTATDRTKGNPVDAVHHWPCGALVSAKVKVVAYRDTSWSYDIGVHAEIQPFAEVVGSLTAVLLDEPEGLHIFDT